MRAAGLLGPIYVRKEQYQQQRRLSLDKHTGKKRHEQYVVPRGPLPPSHPLAPLTSSCPGTFGGLEKTL